MNNKGQIIITDILLYLIILLVIFSIVIYATVTLNDNQVTRINNKQLNNLLEDSISALTKTSGTPNNWEELNVNKVDTVGLKSPKNQLLSYDKLIKLKNNPYLLDKYFPTGIDYSLTMYSKSNPNNEVLIAGKSNFNNKKQIQSKSTVVLFDYAFDITSFKKENMTVYCPYNHSEQWICKTINVNDESLSSGKYYIISDSKKEALPKGERLRDGPFSQLYFYLNAGSEFENKVFIINRDLLDRFPGQPFIIVRYLAGLFIQIDF